MNEIRLLVAPNRSSTTAFMQAISQNPKVHALYQPVKTGIREMGVPDYSLFDGTHKVFKEHPDKVIFAKETFGAIGNKEVFESLRLCTYLVFPDAKSVRRSRPIFLFREPIANWNGCKQVGNCTTLGLFCRAYTSAYNSFVSALAMSDRVTCLTRQTLLANPEYIMGQICDRWDIPFSSSMVSWQNSLLENENFSATEQERKNMRWQQKVLSVTTSFIERPENDELVTEAERDYLHQTLTPLYRVIEKLTKEFYPNPSAQLIPDIEVILR